MIACAVENNVPPTRPEAGERRGISWITVRRVAGPDPEGAPRDVFVPVSCQQCGHEAPCVSVCPQTAVDVDPDSGIVSQIPSRCLGCRYCMAACPYRARSFNWWDPAWPQGTEKALNPDVAPRMRGVVETCNFCHGRLQTARANAAAGGRRDLTEQEYQPACAEACPTGAIVFGDLEDPGCEVARLVRSGNTFRLLERIGTDPKVHYISSREWVRRLGDSALERGNEEATHV
jgi:molybdopterin-containing oxidoreductase family iron-sulfur binding subunit